MEKLKWSLLQKWELDKKYSFVHSSSFLSDGRALILTSEEEDCDKYCVLVLSSLGIRKVEVLDCSDDGRNYPVLFCTGEGFGILKKGQELEYYTGDFSSPERILIRNSTTDLKNIIPQKAQQRYFQVVSDSSLIPVCFEDKVYYGAARCFALLEFDAKTKQAEWKSFSMIDKTAFTHHDSETDDMPKIDSLKISNGELYAFISGESTTSVNKWGMDYYALAKICADGRVMEVVLESDNLKRLDKKGGVNALFTDSAYVIMTPLFKNDGWKGKQRLFSLNTREYFDIGLPRGMTKHQVQNISGDICITSLYDRGLKEIALCRIG
ncbi:hypothetical protein EII17_06875 [Clostridiales bacterium COT073_COT-073]|nr:hypothetical protein EII17_06875 [Clostridiales bacterium COT073_COT-073]